MFTLLMCLGACIAYAQAGYSSASVSMNRANGIATPDQVIVEEYLNYHLHNIPLPQGNEPIALSLDYNQLSPNTFILQTGIATQRLLDFSDMPPINVSLVIDRSGSMQADNKLVKVKTALRKFIQGLREEDFLSIVGYDSEARVILSAQKVGEIYNLDHIIQSIYPGGSTNLHGGLMLGYQEVAKHLSATTTNKVILLTDGIANRGVTDPEQIVEDSYAYNLEGIEVSTIGVGNDLNHALLQQIAHKGKGANHFVGNLEEDITKVFDQELEALLAPVAKGVYLELTFPSEVKVKKIYGYEPEFHKGKIRIPFKNMNQGLTQVVICELEVPHTDIDPIRAQLSYSLSQSSAPVQLNQEINLETQSQLRTTHNEVSKNYYIARMADALKEMAQAVSGGRNEEGLRIVQTALYEVEAAFPRPRDRDMIRVKDILIKQKSALETYIVRR